MSTFGGMVGSSVEEKYEENGSDAMSAAASAAGCCCCAAVGVVDVEGSAVKNEGSNSRVFSSVRGTFSASRFYRTCQSRVRGLKV
jgi:hypothetical protein